MKKIKLAFLTFLTAIFGMGCANSVQTGPFSEAPESGASENTVGFIETAAEETTTTAKAETITTVETTTEATTTAETTTTATTTKAETAAETTTTSDDVAPGHFGVFNGWIMLDGELHAIYTIDAIVLLETEEGYSSLSRLLPDYKEHLSALLTDENLRGVTKKVTDEAEKNGTVSMIQNELETDLDDGMKVYSDGEDICLLIRDRDTDRNYFVNVLIDYENQESLKEIDPESYREMEETGEIIPYDVPNLDPDQIWYAFYPDPSTEPMKPIANEAS